ncbi:hypothetical protein FSP39_005846 [Pinctada imbricata]|uniref:TMC domain-containing protein n=1 Tax=Pinctada imbricata TaxID=66713 RepID=A0AA88XPA1_PINIB|nr:hypothetical protein FSP39_005846 [Pinctada imbricata]
MPKRVTLLLEDKDFELEGDIRKKLPSVRLRRMQTSLSMKDKKRELRRSLRKGTYDVRKQKPFWERYEDLKNRNRLSFRNVTGILKSSTLERVQQGTKGWMERRLLFYGVYQNKTYNAGTHRAVYNMGVAYLSAIFLTFTISFILIIKNSVKNFKASHGVEKSVAKFANKVFGGWDYCIKEKKSAKSRKNILYLDLAADLEEINRIKRLKSRPWSEKIELYLMRLVINILIIILLMGSLSLIGFATERMIHYDDQPLSESARFFYQYVPFLTMSMLNLVVPKVFQRLVEFEEYTHEFEIKLNLVRSILLRLASPIALIAILYVQLVEGIDTDDRTRCGNKRWKEDQNSGIVKCWETYVGQQIYKLIIVDTFAVVFIIIFWHFPRSHINRKYRDKSAVVKALGPQEFNLPKSVVDIVYAQHLCWFGMFFCPLIPIITFVHCLIVFYIKKLTLFHNCRPQSEPYKASRSNSLFMKVLLVSYIFAVFPIGYTIGNIQPSQSCGPFRVYSDKNYRFYTALLDYARSWSDVPRMVFFFFGTGLFIIPLFILLR